MVGSFAGSGDYTAVSNSVVFAITNRSLAGSGDFNGDGTTDLLWQNQTTGLVPISLVKNATITNWVALAYADPTQWKLAGTGNFTGNGTTDVLWINTSSGEVGVWLINNATVTGWRRWPMSTLPPGPSRASATSTAMAPPTCYGRTHRHGERWLINNGLDLPPGPAWATPNPPSGRSSAWET